MSHTFMRLSSLGIGIVLTALSVSRLSAAEPTDPTKNYMGINVTFLNDYEGENAFVDIMKHSRSWAIYSWGSACPVDSENWPTTDCSNVIFGDSIAMGVYKLVFEGKAQSVSIMWCSGSVSNLTYNAATNTSTAEVTLTTTGGGLKFQGTQRTAASATNTGIRNVRLYRPGYPTDGSVVFTSQWLTVMRKFHVIRFMNWLSTNDNPLVSWSQRPNPFKAQPSGSVTINGRSGEIGNAMEHFIQACNAANADLWMNIPPMANDDYVTKTAQLILYGSDGRTPYTSPQANPVYPPLNANLKVYIEYGNEIWNTAADFQCYYWIKTITDSISAATTGTHPIVYDGDRDQYTSVARWAAWRTAEISKLLRSVAGDAAMMTRVRPVLMGQLGGNWFNPRQLPFLEGFYATSRPATDPYPNTSPKPVSYYIYGAGGSGYYGVTNMSTDPNTFFASGNYPDGSYAVDVASDAVWAMNYGVKRIAYEGGMGLDNFTEPQRLTTNADPRMKDVTVTYHNVWSANGGDLLVYFEDVHNGNNSWAFTNSMNNPNSPKLQAIDKLRDTLSRSAVALGGVAPCTTIVQSGNPSISVANGFYTSTVSGESVLNGFTTAGYWIAVPVTARQAGWYRLSVRCGAGGSSTVSLWVDGTNVATRTAPSQLGNTAYVTVPLRSGLNVVRYQVLSGGSYIRSIMLSASDTTVSVAPAPCQAAGPKASSLAVKAASGLVVAHVPVSSGGRSMFAVYDVEGKCVTRGKVGEHATGLVLPRLVHGTYLLRVSNKSGAAGSGVQNVATMVVR
jgi:hypothetical protein